MRCSARRREKREGGVPNHEVVSKEQWIDARKRLLIKEKEFMRLRDQLSQQRRDLPWEAVEKESSTDRMGGKRSRNCSREEAS
jgi:predicted dithiol-disulfide oxidoreductase (DUF899 family)